MGTKGKFISTNPNTSVSRPVSIPNSWASVSRNPDRRRHYFRFFLVYIESRVCIIYNSLVS
uniref:Uncharacterized protein n=1 Tax=Lepeophtheirus salmonis TaxID=72036 RepID=A0A0K2VIB5_LEPSM